MFGWDKTNNFIKILIAVPFEAGTGEQRSDVAKALVAVDTIPVQAPPMDWKDI